MILELHLCGPKGEGQRQLLDLALALVQLDNQFLIEAMLRDGREVFDLVDDLGLRYAPPTAAEARSPREPVWGLGKMLEEGRFSCRDAAAYEAAVLVVKYQIFAQAYVLPVRVDGLWHAVYRTAAHGQIDPTQRFLAKQGRHDFVWEALR